MRRSLVQEMAQRVLFALDPEMAHDLSIRALSSGLLRASVPPPDSRLAVRVAGLDFANPLGLAAGYDKNGEVPDALAGLGFGLVEVGTLTPRPQAGNTKPRVFRLRADKAVINRLGFNNDGHDAAHARLQRLRLSKAMGGCRLGINIGANKDTADRVADYGAGVTAFHALADYFTANISSPNTPGLRDLQHRDELQRLTTALITTRDRVSQETGRRVPLFIKIAPDLDEAALADIATVVTTSGIDGVIVSNTTLARPGLKSVRHAKEAGGLSGKPLFSLSTAVLARMRRLVGPDLALIGVGGIMCGDTVIEKMRAGADLVQLYTGLIYGGPGMPARILQDLSRICSQRQLSRLSQIRDEGVAQWSAVPLE